MRDTNASVAERKVNHRGLAALAASQDGLFTSQQSEHFGLTRQLLSHHARTKRYERQARGLYSVPEIPASPFQSVVASWLQVGSEAAVVSHETALALHDLSDIIVDRIHITIPRAMRSRKAPAGTVLRTRLERYGEFEVQRRNFVPVTAPIVTILDCLESGTGFEQIEIAISRAIERCWMTPFDLRSQSAKRGRRLIRTIDQLLEHVEALQ